MILLHGLARTHRSMARIEKALKQAGYKTLNCNYPSRKQPIESLSTTFITEAIEQSREASNPVQIHFVTHSMGGILVRYYLAQQRINELGRVVMLAPPNAGSELVDFLSRFQLFRRFHGPAATQLGTNPTNLPSSLGAVDYEVGIIAGNRSFNPLWSALIPGENDGKVSTRSTRLDGMSDYIVLPHSHSFMMNQPQVIRQTIHFLQQGKFDHG